MTFASFIKDIWFIIVMTILAVLSKFGLVNIQAIIWFTKNEGNIAGAGMVSRVK